MKDIRIERRNYIDKMIKKANELVKDYTWDKNKELWDMAFDWNANHTEEEEIFMCEIWEEDGYDGNGFMIEDDYWYFDN